MRMPFAMGRSGYGLQHSHGADEALPVLRARIVGASYRNDRHRRAAIFPCGEDVLGLARPSSRSARDVSARRRVSGTRTRLVQRVLEPLELADFAPHRPYWKFLWESNPPTFYSSPLSSGSPLRSSTAAEADAGAVSHCAYASRNRRIFPRSTSSSSPMRQSRCEKSFDRRNRLSHRSVTAWFAVVGQAVSPANRGSQRLFTQTRQRGGISMAVRTPTLTHGAGKPSRPFLKRGFETTSELTAPDGRGSIRRLQIRRFWSRDLRERCLMEPPCLR
jgi:hypothetical protein